MFYFYHLVYWVFVFTKKCGILLDSSFVAHFDYSEEKEVSNFHYDRFKTVENNELVKTNRSDLILSNNEEGVKFCTDQL